MSKLKDELLARRNQIEIQLKEYRELLSELAEIDQALTALNPPQCNCKRIGCGICRIDW